MILESPHISEYQLEENCNEPRPAPARDKKGAGGAIKTFLPIMFDQHFDEYYSALINVVQFQCSLGNSLDGKKNTAYRVLKDKIFWTFFQKETYQRSFIDRMKAMYDPLCDIIVVCSTGGEDRRNEVFNVLKANMKNLKYVLSIAHPSSWSRNCNNRKVSIVHSENLGRKNARGFFCEKDYDKLYHQLLGKQRS